jgi:FAD/FMN-containing dehydrogenase
VNGKGEIVECSETENQDLFKAAQVSLGTLGVITQITLQCVPAYKLALQNNKEKIDNVINTFQDSIQNHRNFEFYWFPYTEGAWTKTANIVTDQPDKLGIVNYLNDVVLENYAYKLLAETARVFPSFNQTVCNISAALIPTVRKVYHSHKVYATTRLVRFNEMEYNVPLDAFEEVFKEMKKTITHRKFNIHFPIEHRVVKADDIYLSPAYNRDSAYIACHVYNKKDFKPYFKALEEIFLAHGGRPHWGKMHTLNVEQVKAKYPKFDDFKKHQNKQDPNGLFLNGYLKNLLG